MRLGDRRQNRLLYTFSLPIVVWYKNCTPSYLLAGVYQLDKCFRFVIVLLGSVFAPLGGGYT
jgi:hypothetical protein